MADRTIEDLQRELLAVARGGQYMATWARINGVQGSDAINLRGEMDKLSRIRSLRRQIRAINPNAACYYGWGGPADASPCRCCNNTGVVDNGWLTSEGGAEFSEGPIKIVKTCPECDGRSA